MCRGRPAAIFQLFSCGLHHVVAQHAVTCLWSYRLLGDCPCNPPVAGSLRGQFCCFDRSIATTFSGVQETKGKWMVCTAYRWIHGEHLSQTSGDKKSTNVENARAIIDHAVNDIWICWGAV
ncbi:unnamed protein product [Boreogadus saida]